MPAIANIVINDGKAVPVAHTFEPARTSADFALYEDRSSSQYIGMNKLVISMKRPTGPSKTANRNVAVTCRLETPVLETLGTSDSGLTPAPTVAYRPMMELTVTLPERSLLSERKDLHTMFRNFLLTPAFTDAVEKFSIPF